ncbi:MULTISPECIES: signal peptidase II [Cellulomonas]|jgi:signal peptidase II|uniref:Lipoprotein signal peptidase n=2 Tax=Cellulomonas TaxID=1707 RepID=F8A428_CELGA|nr:MULTISPECIES: signal peptidase II [Cellulomonas]AEI10791.1 lipoprotein signal peptidase [Cellulomonas gilvus ATCC 13127]NKY38004.1 signal peptidase II [Cellulomonas septica]HWB35287.1 signal peptidase II [Rugosimonospora sp.]
MTVTTATARQTGARGPAGRRVAAALGVTLVAAVDLAAKAWAVAALQDRVIPVGPVDLRLAYNPGVAFSVGAGAPTWLVLTVTSLVTAAVGVVAWRTAAAPSRERLAALALVLGGAVANLVDRAGDGVVTDYLHSGWFPTFNLADTAIVIGAALLVLTGLRHLAPDDAEPSTRPNRSEGERST